MKPPVPSRERPQTLVLRAYGRTVALDGPAPALAAARERLPPTYRFGTTPPERRWAVREHPGTGWAAQVEEQVLSFRGSVVEATEAVLSDLELWVAEFARKRVFIHAGCVAMDGQAIVLPGRSIAGIVMADRARKPSICFPSRFSVGCCRGLRFPEFDWLRFCRKASAICLKMKP